MAIDFQRETLLTLSQARHAFPGRSVGLASLNRWLATGVRGVKLETILIGGQRFTSKQAIARFIAAQNAAQSNE